ncbi:hypothetical protein KUG47_12400 [Falsochrobactrum sp. TDYN1]|uniref:Uncharacterized protein n=1 Tax=Falsochrobactrum tianjinense TaxID=2706015 RepID=A0A949PQB6_9HYPH|nr:hypothetical protein [Falsochrobactrum sp. TDYN1]MBV2144294.1 hypothetical protein [Falsochrobactrum sp. TDYN1]
MTETKKSSNAALAAIIILLGFGLLAYFLPTIMLALGGYSQTLAIVFPIVFVLGFFAVFWLRARSQKKKRD